jgi:hypothetical protein
MTPCRPPGATEITAGGLAVPRHATQHGGALLFSLASFLLDDATVFTTSVRSVLLASQQKPGDLVAYSSSVSIFLPVFEEGRKAGKQESDLV